MPLHGQVAHSKLDAENGRAGMLKIEASIPRACSAERKREEQMAQWHEQELDGAGPTRLYGALAGRAGRKDGGSEPLKRKQPSKRTGGPSSLQRSEMPPAHSKPPASALLQNLTPCTLCCRSYYFPAARSIFSSSNLHLFQSTSPPLTFLFNQFYGIVLRIRFYLSWFRASLLGVWLFFSGVIGRSLLCAGFSSKAPRGT